jgi:hypothetical protein
LALEVIAFGVLAGFCIGLTRIQNCAAGVWICRPRGSHAMHKPERRGVEDEPHLIGGRVMARHAVREELRLVQFDQVLHLPALAIDVLVKMLRSAFTPARAGTSVGLLIHLRASVRISKSPTSAGANKASAGTDARTIQAYLGHRNISNTVRYTELSTMRFKGLFSRLILADAMQAGEQPCQTKHLNKPRELRRKWKISLVWPTT